MPRLIHRPTEHDRVRQREVNMFENALLRLRVRHQTLRLNTIFVNNQNLTRVNLSLISSLD
ncbi:hypothetical protein YC2023_007246 [Brassica napus]